MLNNLLKKVYRKAFSKSLHEAIQTNIIKGNNVIIDPSAIISEQNNGKIIFEGDNYIGRNVEIGALDLIEIGYGTSLQDRCILLGDIEIGKYCTFAPNVYMSSGRHYYNLNPNYYIKDQDSIVAADSTLSKAHSKKVIIGDDCWLGINSVIMSGVSIGRGCVIGANSVVTKNLDPFSVVAGAPAKLIKTRLDFISKNSLSFENENDLSNFYKGFFIDLPSLNHWKLFKGIATSNNFTFYLNNDSKKIIIQLKKIASEALTIEYNDQKIKLDSTEYVSITFNSSQTNYHNFLIKGIDDKLKKCLLIKSVELVNQ